jgi:putative cell wall-binding protein
MESVSRTTTRGVGAVAAAALLLTAVAVLAPVARAGEHVGEDAAPDAVEVERIAGDDRAWTAADVARETFDEAGTALVARFDSEFDALAASFLAGCLDAPILLTWTTPRTVGGEVHDVHPATVAALEDLGVENVVILGGDAAVSPEVADALAEDYEVERVSGTAREDTAQAIAEYEGCEVGGTVMEGDLPILPQATAVLARRDVSVDALAGGGLAFDGGFPVLLTSPAALAPQAEEALETLEIDRVLILGGEMAISSDVEDELEELGYDTVRLAGTNRWETAIALAEFAVEFAGWDETEIGLARSDVAFDAMTSAPYTGTHQAPLLLATTLDGAALHPATEAYLEERADTIVRLTVFGGAAAVPESVAGDAEAAATAAGEDEDGDGGGEDDPPGELPLPDISAG